MAYSVLMSVYAKENAAYFSDAVESMLHQSCPPDQFVLVCDGPLTPGLDEAIQRFTASRDGGLFRVLRLPENVGLGRALQAGLPLCDHDLVARMDSDDLALPLRMEHQLALMAADPELAAVGGQIAEFTGAPDNIQGYRIVPTSPEEARRGGREYFRQTVQLERALRGCGLIGTGAYCKNLAVRFCGTVLLPDSLRQRVYQRHLRQREPKGLAWAGKPCAQAGHSVR